MGVDAENGWRLGEGLRSLLFSSSACIANLEGVLGEHTCPALKTGKPIQGNIRLARLLNSTGIQAVSLANNHAFDYGWAGVKTTMEALEEQRVLYVGAGECEEDAWRFESIMLGECRVGIIGISHNEFGVACGEQPGVAGFDELMALRSVRAAKESCEKVIVLYHGGIEYMRFPSPNLRKRCLFLLEAGADAVICQHSHIAGACEVVGGKPIVYGQGDFMAFTSHRSIQEAKCPAFVVELQPYQKTAGFKLKIHPIRIIRTPISPSTEMLKEEALAEALIEMNEIDALLSDRPKWKRKWEESVRQMGPAMESQLAQASSFRRRLGGRISMFRKRVPTQYLTVLENMIRCEAHYEAIIAWLTRRSTGGES